MARINACFVSAALITLATVTEVQAASLYATKCESLSPGSTVSEPAAQALNVQIVQRTGTPPSSDRDRREHVRISAGLATALGITAGDVALSGEAAQLRVNRGSGSPKPAANFTASAIDVNDNTLKIAVWLPEDLGSTGSFNDHDNGFFKLFGAQNPATVFASGQFATVHDMAPASTFVVDDGVVTQKAHFTEPNAQVNKQFRECVELRDGKLIAVLVPHGGGIETKISGELKTLLSEFDPNYYTPSVWEGAGQWGSGSTFERWHVTATQISGDSFPGYGDLEDSGPYQYALGLHGFAKSERAVVLGGRSSRQVKCHLASTIEQWLDANDLDGKITYKIFAPDGDDVDVVRASTGPGDNPKPLTGVDDLDGSSVDNIVNRVSPNPTGERGYGGIQVELSTGVRNDTTLFPEFMRGLAHALSEPISLDPNDDYCAQYE